MRHCKRTSSPSRSKSERRKPNVCGNTNPKNRACPAAGRNPQRAVSSRCRTSKTSWCAPIKNWTNSHRTTTNWERRSTSWGRRKIPWRISTANWRHSSNPRRKTWRRPLNLQAMPTAREIKPRKIWARWRNSQNWGRSNLEQSAKDWMRRYSTTSDSNSSSSPKKYNANNWNDSKGKLNKTSPISNWKNSKISESTNNTRKVYRNKQKSDGASIA